MLKVDFQTDNDSLYDSVFVAEVLKGEKAKEGKKRFRVDAENLWKQTFTRKLNILYKINKDRRYADN